MGQLQLCQWRLTLSVNCFKSYSAASHAPLSPSPASVARLPVWHLLSTATFPPCCNMLCCAVLFRLDTDFCPGSLWVADQRFAWFDLTANLTFYGPGPGGKGQVGGYTHTPTAQPAWLLAGSVATIVSYHRDCHVCVTTMHSCCKVSAAKGGGLSGCHQPFQSCHTHVETSPMLWLSLACTCACCAHVTVHCVAAYAMGPCCTCVQVFAHSTPILKHYRPEARAKAILPDLAALIWSACQVRDEPCCDTANLGRNCKATASPLRTYTVTVRISGHFPKALNPEPLS